MKKYAMVAINSKRNDENMPIVRRVLISYKKYKDNVFYGTAFIEKDHYFYDTSASHQYIFKDECYYLVTGYNFDNYLKGEERPYHWLSALTARHLPYTAPILFTAKTRQEAIDRLKNRPELKD